MAYTYLAGAVGHTKGQGVFRALSRGFTQWSSGQLSVLEINTQHPNYCHVRSTMKPSMNAGTYQVYVLLGRTGDLATMAAATCECAAGYATSFLHAVLHVHT